MSERVSRRGRWAFGLTLTAFAWSCALVVAACVVPVYHGESSWSDGARTVTRTSATSLVEGNGAKVLIPLAMPVLLVAIVWVLLHRRCARGAGFGDAVAWALITLLAGFVLLTAITVGTFYLPLVVLLTAAAVLTPDGVRRA